MLACVRSHYLTYEKFLASANDFALILEDDFEISKAKRVKEILEGNQFAQFDLLQIGFLNHGIFNKIRWTFEEIEKLIFRSVSFLSNIIGNHSLRSRLRVREAAETPKGFTMSSFFPGTHSYIVSRSMAMSLLANTSTNLSADEYFIALSKMRSFRMARTSRSTVTQDGSVPSIENRFKMGNVK